MKKSLIVCAVVASLAPSLALADVSFGIASNRGELKAKQQWSEFVSEMSKSIASTVNLVPVPIESAAQAFADKKVDFMIANPQICAVAQEKNGGVPIATVDYGKGVEFGGVILANKASGISKIADMKGKKIISYTKDSAGAYLFQAYELKKNGIDINKDFATLVVAKKQDDIPMAVKSNMFDAGFVRTGILESMEKQGLLKIDDFVIVNKIDDGFAHVHSTPLYPEWCLVAQGGADAETVKKVTSFVMGAKPEDSAMKKAEIKGFVAPLDMKGLLELTKAME